MRYSLLLILILAASLTACAGQAVAYTHPAGAIVIQGKEMKYLADSITVKAGEPVTLIFENTGALEHGLIIDELGVEIAHIQPGQNGAATFTPQTPGAYTFYCNEPGHKQANMIGTLIVRP